MSAKPRFRFVNVVWGEDYTHMFMNLSLPTLLWPNNLKYFCENTDSVFCIYTTSRDAARMKAHPTYNRLADLMPVEFKLIDEDVDLKRLADTKYQTMNAMHRHFIQEAQAQNCALFFLQPDVIVGDGSFKNLLSIVETGKRAIMVSGPRLTKETVMPWILKNYTQDDILQPMSCRDVVKIAMQHLHTDTESLFWGNAPSSIEPYYLLWKVDAGNMLLRAFHLHPIIINPRRRDVVPEVTLDVDYVQKACPDFNDIYVVEDTDEFVFFSMTNLYEREEFLKPGKTGLYDIVRYARTSTNAFHQSHLQHKIHYHSDDLSNDWTVVEEESDHIVQLVLSILGRPVEIKPQPTLSVVMQNFNQGELAIESIKTVFKQSQPASEIIILDNSSTDKSLEILSQMQKQNSQVKLFKNTQKLEVPENQNQLVEFAQSEYLYFLTPGDLLRPDFFKKSLLLLSNFPGAGICFSDFTQFETMNGQSFDYRFGWSQLPVYFFPEELVTQLPGEQLPLHSSIIKKEFLEKAGGFSKEFKWYADWLNLHIIAFRQGAFYIPEPMVTFRHSHNSYLEAGKRNLKIQRMVLQELIKKMNSSNVSDVLPYFVRSCLFSNFDQEIIQSVLSNPKMWNPELLLLLQEPLKNWQAGIQQLIIKKRQLYNENRAQVRLQQLFSHANIAIKAGRTQEALNIFEVVIREFPQNTAGYAAKATITASMGRDDLAYEALSIALTINPNDAKVNLQMGLLLVRQGRLAEAEQFAQKVRILDPANPKLGELLKNIQQKKSQPSAGQRTKVV